MTQVAANNQRFEVERNLQLALERQGREIAEIRRQVNLWNNNVSSKEAYPCWAQQQANPNLSESNFGASSSSQVDPKEPVPLRTAPPSPHFRPPKNEERRKLDEQKGRKLEHSARAPTPRRPEQQPWSSSPTPRCGHQCLGVPSPPQGQVIHA
ncbi:hypothetical protein PIB30_063276 [Stylosanthes scabra]|uniref:Uncharacterized protein n=1 Tax=Stylosanthes scabra TaxID=79078 RepID=A0ABU6VJM1_9FABA|nr:hypothetical protein [Stylosanthes scabra]